MLVTGKNEENSKQIEHPRERVNKVEALGRVCRGESAGVKTLTNRKPWTFKKRSHPLLTFGEKEVQKGESHGMAAEHIVTTGSNSLNRHAAAAPDDKRLIQFVHPVAVGPGLAVEVSARHRETGDQHGDAP